MFLLILLQAATATSPAADIELDVRVQAREVRIERSGTTSLTVSGGPGSDVSVDKPAADGRRRLRNVDARVRAEARVADPRQNPPAPETGSPD
jgi:hypothetical protein